MFISTPTDKSRFDAESVSFIPGLTHPVYNRNIEVLLRSNAPPSKMEEEDLLPLVQRGDAVVADIDLRIKATKDVLDFLAKERDQAISNITDAQSLFHFSCKLNEEQVCREWRRVEMHAPEVRSHISLSFSAITDVANDPMRSFMLGLCLGCTLDRPLSLSINSARDISKDQLFWMLVPTVSRWREVDFDMPYESFQALSLYKGFLGGLKFLSVYIRGPVLEGSATIDTFSMASQLRELHATVVDNHSKFLFSTERIQCDKSKTKNVVILRNLRNLGITERFSIDHGHGSAAQFMHCAEISALEMLRVSLVPTAGPVFPAAALYPIATLDISCRLSRLENLIIGADNIPSAFFKSLVYSQRGNKGTNVLLRLQRIDLHRSTLADGDETTSGLLSLIWSRRTGSAGRTTCTPRRAKRMSALGAPLVVEYDQMLLNEWK
ncbi:hypothetical protein DFS33DRAFT_1270953 [Desarmillaria ectypa]|nr:hypothetical protein DFS33DRAFT_1270953 [Desarmillaria ectypa]